MIVIFDIKTRHNGIMTAYIYGDEKFVVAVMKGIEEKI